MRDTEADRAGTRATPWDDAWLAILRAARSGVLAEGRPWSVAELAARLGAAPGAVRGALFRLEYQGFARRVDDDVVVLTQAGPERWAAGTRALVGMLEYAVRSAVPVLTADDVDRYRTLVDEADRSLRLRSDGARSALLATLGFWVDVCPDVLLARFTRRMLELVTFGLVPGTAWRTWDADAWLASSLLAATTGDRDTAHDAGHALARFRDVRVADVEAQAGLADGTLVRPPDLRPAVPSVVPSSAVGTAWDSLLGAVRSGALEAEQRYTVDDVVRITGQRDADADLAVRQLEVMGLARFLPGNRTDFSPRTPSLDEWAENAAAVVAFAELGLRILVGHDDHTQVAEARAIVDQVRRHATVRDPRLTSALVDLAGWIADHVPDPFVRDALHYTHSRAFLLLDEPPPFRQWGVTDVAAHLDRAFDGDERAAANAAHALARHVDAHVTDVRDRYGTMGT